MHRKPSPVRLFTLAGGLLGLAIGWGITIGPLSNFHLHVGGKPLFSIPPFGVVAYICTILFGALATVAGMIINARLPQVNYADAYDARLSSDHFGIRVYCQPEEAARYAALLIRKRSHRDTTADAMTPTEHSRMEAAHVQIMGALPRNSDALRCTSDQPGKQYALRTDMYTQPSYRHNEEPRPTPAGTVATGRVEAPVADSASAALLHNPFVFAPESADTAKMLFETYCSPCHGLAGKGDGLVAAKFQTPPDLTAPRYVRAPDGYLYSVARNGIRIMPPQSENTTARERWLIISHLRSLQKQ